MRNLTFVLWICLWPVAYKFACYLEFLAGAQKHASDTVELTVSCLFMLTWIGIAYLLYERSSAARPADLASA